MVQSIVPTSTLSAPIMFSAGLSPDALMVYLSTRLNGLDDQINGVFNTEQRQAKVQTALRNIQTTLSTLDENAGKDGKPVAMPERDPGAVDHADGKDAEGNIVGASPAEKNIDEQLAIIAAVDPNLAKAMGDQLAGEGYILFTQDGLYVGSEVTATKQYIEGLQKDLESSSQMNMIHLQSMMSSRQTAIQLSTNMISALGESTKAIATNVGK